MAKKISRGEIPDEDSKKHQAVYRPRAAFDIQSIVIYVGEVLKAPAAAKDLYESIQSEIEKLCDMPTLGRVFHDDLLGREYRSRLDGNYKIFYSLDATTLTVWRVVHTRQDIDDFDIIGWDE